MPINDVNGHPLVYYNNFPNDDVRNIEIGAGKNYFGKREFPRCYITDLKTPSLEHFTNYDDYENQDCHYIDTEFDYFESNINGRTFDNIICCNPSEYGFLGLGYAKDFLNKAGELLNDDGSIFILGHKKNPWANARKIEKYLKQLKESEQLLYNLEIVDFEIIDEQHRYIQEYKFTRCDIETSTQPNEKIVIKKTA